MTDTKSSGDAARLSEKQTAPPVLAHTVLSSSTTTRGLQSTSLKAALQTAPTDAAVKKCSELPLNDTGNAKRLVTYFGSHLLHVRDVGWHWWDGTRWCAEGGNELATSCAQATAALISFEADLLEATPAEQIAIQSAEQAAGEIAGLKSKGDLNNSEQREVSRLEAVLRSGGWARGELAKRKAKRRYFGTSSGNTARIIGMLAQALPHRTVTTEAIDSHPLKLNVENGTLVFQKRIDLECPDPNVDRLRWDVSFSSPDPLDQITKIARVNYDPSARCPRFMTFLDLFQPNLAIRKFLQVYMGYSLTGLSNEQCLMFSYGTGANGKSTFIDVIARILGGYVQTLPFESLAGALEKRGDQATPDFARLPGARLVRASEPQGDVRLKEGLIKSLTGGEPMLVRHLNKSFFEFRPEFKLALSGNKKPVIIGVDHGIWRRIRLVPWPVTIPESEKRPYADVLSELLEERSGILNWLLEGAIEYLQHGLRAPPEIVAATDAYRQEMDPLGSFIAACVEIVPPVDGRPRSSVTAREMYEAYCCWCYANSERPFKEKTFGLTMPQKGIAKTEERIRRYLDVRLHDVPARRMADATGYTDADDVVPA